MTADQEAPEKFPDAIVRMCWDNTVADESGKDDGHCGCPRTSHGHETPCGNPLTWENRGEGTGAWDAHHRVPVKNGGRGTLGNCEILCIPCHEAVSIAQQARDS